MTLQPHIKTNTRLLKLLKHYYSNSEKWWLLRAPQGGNDFHQDWFPTLQELRTVYSQSVGNWEDEDIEEIIKRLSVPEKKQLFQAILEDYKKTYFPLVEQAYAQTINHAQTGNQVGTLHGYPRFEYCFTHKKEGDSRNVYVSKDNIVIICTAPKNTNASTNCNKNLITSYREPNLIREEVVQKQIIKSYPL